MSEHQQTGTTQQALDLALRHHGAGDLPKAKGIYQQILQADPNHPDALHLLGVIAQQEGKNDIAIDLITKAIVLKPEYAEAHANLGTSLKNTGLLDDAIASFTRAIEINPELAVAHNNLGNALEDQGHPRRATASYHKALAIDPDYAEAHSNLSLALMEQGLLDEAVASCRKALAIQPDFAEAHNNLGAALQDLGRLEEAAASYRKTLDLKPDFAEAHNNLGNALQGLGRMEEAEESYRKALSIQPDFTEALGSYGILFLALGRKQEALSYFRKKLELVRGENPTSPDLESFRFITKVKMKHDIEQFRYLESLGVDADRFGELARTYSELDQEIQWPDKDSTAVPLTSDQRDRIGNSYNRPVHLLETPEIPGSALNQDLNAKSITRSYMDNAPGMTYFDNFLNPEALHALRRFLMESTIWYDFKYSGGYLGAMLLDGMACPLLFQIADELRQTFPDIFKHHPLNQLWAFKYDSQLTGINVHADFAAVNVNFWITPDSANLNPGNGGLVVYKEEAPLDWNIKVYNRDRQRIREFLEKHNNGEMVVPYAENRIVLFNSNLFHETDTLEFKPGYENRRINITMLFGDRGN